MKRLVHPSQKRSFLHLLEIALSLHKRVKFRWRKKRTKERWFWRKAIDDDYDSKLNTASKRRISALTTYKPIIEPLARRVSTNMSLPKTSEMFNIKTSSKTLL